MLNVYQSNRTERLVDALSLKLSRDPAGPFDPTVILTHSFGLGQWLRIGIAERLGIAAGVVTSLPATWIWRLCQEEFGLDADARRSAFDTDVMTFMLARLLAGTSAGSAAGEPLAAVTDYIGQGADRDLRAYQLAARLAHLYDQYLLYRPDWMLAWELGSEHPEGDLAWVAVLWQRLTAETTEPHRVRLYAQLAERLATRPPANAPSRVSIFGLSTLPPAQLEVFSALAQHIEVDLYFLNPCQHYWGDVASERDQARRSIRELVRHGRPLTDDDYFEAGNPLLSSMGKQGREFLEMLLEADATTLHETWESPGTATALASLQRDILNLERGGTFLDEPGTHMVGADDRSLQIHACHSPLREVEVLYDQLQLLFETTPDLSPHEIIVMMPNVSTYAPFIEARFRDHLPFSIADRNPVSDSAVILSFRSLLDTAHARFTAPEVMDLLEVPLIAARYGLIEDDLALISAWIGSSGIRWGLSGEEKQARWELPAEPHNTWRFGLDRMLHGYAARAEDGLVDGVLPFDIDSGDVHVLQALQAFIDDLGRWAARLREPRSVPEWAVTLTALVETFYGDPSDEVLELQLIRDALEALVSVAAQAGFDLEMEPAPFREALDGLLGLPARGGALLTGGITFASLVPMRSIPFRVVCLLGMNDGEFPRHEAQYSFDVRGGEHRPGDRSRRLDDQYLFLEAALSAREVLYLSYRGRRITDNRRMLPSILVAELREYCESVLRLPDGTPPTLVTEHPLQPFDPQYFGADARLPSYQQEWYQAEGDAANAEPTFLAGLVAATPQTVIELSELVSFFRNPARFFLRARLGVVFESHADYLDDVESFTLGALDNYQLAESALSWSLDSGNEAAWRGLMVASGRVLPGTPGRLMLDDAWRKADEIVRRVDKLIDGNPFEKPVDLTLGNVRLVGRVDRMFDAGRVFFRTGRVRDRQLVATWVEHLALNAQTPGHMTYLVDNENDQSLSIVDRERATCLLTELVDLFRASDARPPRFLPETSRAFFEGLAKGEYRARERAYERFSRGNAGSEGTDASYTRLFDLPADLDDEFARTAVRIYGPLFEALS